MKNTIVLAASVLAALVLIAAIASSCATQRQAQATIDVARAAQMASAGQSIGTLALTCMAGLLGIVILGAGSAIGFLAVKNSRLQQQLAGGNSSAWLPGGGQRINGQWFPGGGKLQGDPNQAIAQMMLLQLLQQQSGAPVPQQQPLALPASDDRDWRW